MLQCKLIGPLPIPPRVACTLTKQVDGWVVKRIDANTPKDTPIYQTIERINKVAVLVDEDNLTIVANKTNNDAGAHYRFEYKSINLDPFRIASIYELDFVQSTILKKVLVTGNRGYKNKEQDYKDIICAAQRGLQMLAEDK